MKNSIFLSVALLSPIVAAPALAQDSTPAANPASSEPEVVTGGDSLSIAIGVGTIPSYEGSDTNRIVPIGVVRGSLSGINFITRGTQLFVDVVPNDPGPGFDFELGPVVGANFNRNSIKRIDDPRVGALGTRKTAIEVGGYLGIGKTGLITSDYDKLSFSVSYIRDVNNAHKSYLITPQLDYGTPLSRKAYVGISANATYAGDGYAQTYFSVDAPGSLASTLPQYSAGKGWKNYSISGLATYSLTGDLTHGLSLIGGVSYSRLLNDFAESPVTRIAGDRNQWLGAIGIGYTF
ncbi:MipA/OmpV family protein [Sphingomonas sp. So64.6b]|uniref:MipA/OmpV family protein n=1 Tax=Sphingomonas sp. So64.6b TaxID=2997354 RepID=UPI0016003160|nr:MipA/OmpV family protein [Sphingomonas sp. So64.6b]QNA85928.1 MipA/OmpV family protein [Sphingomonas sp. So64.6b]